MRRPSADQVGPELIARVAPKVWRRFPSASNTASPASPLLCLTATIRVPSGDHRGSAHCTSRLDAVRGTIVFPSLDTVTSRVVPGIACTATILRSEEHTSELQSRLHLVCRLLLEKK